VSKIVSLLALTVFWSDTSQAAWNTKIKDVSLVQYGLLDMAVNDQRVTYKEFRVSYGDPRKQDAEAVSPSRTSLGPFAMNAAFYYHNADGTWNLFNFRLPSESLTEASAIDERLKFRDYLGRKEVRSLMGNPYNQVDFGSDGDFIVKRMKLTHDRLPEPFNQLSTGVLESIESILIYNADGTGKIYFRKPLDLDGFAQTVFERLNREIQHQGNAIFVQL